MNSTQAFSLDLRGCIWKRGGGRSALGKRNWKPRFCVVDNGHFCYYETEGDFATAPNKPLKAPYNLIDCDVLVGEAENESSKEYHMFKGSVVTSFAFRIQPRNSAERVMVLRCETEKQRTMWMERIAALVLESDENASQTAATATVSAAETQVGRETSMDTHAVVQHAAKIPFSADDQHNMDNVKLSCGEDSSNEDSEVIRGTPVDSASKEVKAVEASVACANANVNAHNQHDVHAAYDNLSYGEHNEASGDDTSVESDHTLPTHVPGVVISGLVWKRGGGTRKVLGSQNWKQRWCVVTDTSFSYFKSAHHWHRAPHKTLKKPFNLRSCLVVLGEGGLADDIDEKVATTIPFAFRIQPRDHSKRAMVLRCETEEQRTLWMGKLKAAIQALDAMAATQQMQKQGSSDRHNHSNCTGSGRTQGDSVQIDVDTQQGSHRIFDDTCDPLQFKNIGPLPSMQEFSRHKCMTVVVYLLGFIFFPVWLAAACLLCSRREVQTVCTKTVNRISIVLGFLVMQLALLLVVSQFVDLNFMHMMNNQA